MRLGLNLLLWSGGVGQTELDLLPGIAELGYDGVELPLLAPDAVDTGAVRRALGSAGLACTASSAIPRGASLLDAEERPRGVAFLGRTAAVAAATSIWRDDIVPDAWAYARDTFAFMRRLLG